MTTIALSTPAPTPTPYLHAQVDSLQNIRSVVSIILKPLSLDYKQWRKLVLLMLHHYALNDHVLSDIADPSVYWARLDSIVVT
jgi:hypothetical protein